MNDTFKHYLTDLAFLIIEEAKEAKVERDAAKNDDRVFASGKLLAYYSIVSLMQAQALAFQIPSEDIGLSGINPDKDLV